MIIYYESSINKQIKYHQFDKINLKFNFKKFSWNYYHLKC